MGASLSEKAAIHTAPGRLSPFHDGEFLNFSPTLSHRAGFSFPPQGTSTATPNPIIRELLLPIVNPILLVLFF